MPNKRAIDDSISHHQPAAGMQRITHHTPLKRLPQTRAPKENMCFGTTIKSRFRTKSIAAQQLSDIYRHRATTTTTTAVLAAALQICTEIHKLFHRSVGLTCAANSTRTIIRLVAQSAFTCLVVERLHFAGGSTVGPSDGHNYFAEFFRSFFSADIFQEIECDRRCYGRWRDPSDSELLSTGPPINDHRSQAKCNSSSVSELSHFDARFLKLD